MAKLKVGDSARVVGARFNPQHIGEIVVVVELGGGLVTSTGRRSMADSDCLVEFPNGRTYGALFDNLEPLTPPGQKEFKAEDVLTLEGLPDFTIAMPKKEAA